MSTISNNIDDFLDDELHQSLSKLGYIFPSTISDFKEIVKSTKEGKRKQPKQLKDPYKFLNHKVYNPNENLITVNDETDYSEIFAQAAREGKQISEEVKIEMQNDKLKSRDKKNDV